MLDGDEKKGLCSVCGERIASVHTEAMPGTEIYICESCLELAKHNFIWICMSCGRSYFRPKSTVLERLKDPELLRAYEACADMQLIQGIDMCIECDPESVIEHVAGAKKERIAGRC